MKIEIEVPEEKVIELVCTRIDELFSGDARYRETGVRELVQRLVDKAAVAAVEGAQDAIAAELPTLAEEAVRRATKEAIDAAAKRGLAALKKLYAGFDPNRLTPEQKEWVVGQIAKTATMKEVKT